MFGSNDDKQSPAPAGKASAEAGEKKSLFGWLRKKPQGEPTPAAPAEATTAPAVESAAPTLPGSWVTAPAVAKHYQLGLQPGANQDYTLSARALPGDGQNDDQQGDTSCAVLTVRVQGLESQHEPAACWQ